MAVCFFRPEDRSSTPRRPAPAPAPSPVNGRPYAKKQEKGTEGLNFCCGTDRRTPEQIMNLRYSRWSFLDNMAYTNCNLLVKNVYVAWKTLYAFSRQGYQFEHRLATLRREHEAEKLRMKAEHEDEIIRLQELQEQEINRVRIEHEARQEMMSDAFADERHSLVMQHQMLDQRRLEQEQHMDRLVNRLAPLQSAMESGNIFSLTDELERFDSDEEAATPRTMGSKETAGTAYGVLGVVMQPVAKLAREKLLTWRGVARVVANVLTEVRQARSHEQFNELVERLFRALKDAQMTGMNVVAGDPEAPQHIFEALSLWHEDVIGAVNEVQSIVLARVANCEPLESFDFADFEYVLRMVDVGNDDGFFLPRAKALIDDIDNNLAQLPRILGHLQTVIFFLKYFDREDLQQTYDEFRKSNNARDALADSLIAGAQEIYPPGWELLQCKGNLGNLSTEDIERILTELRLGAERMLNSSVKGFKHRHSADDVLQGMANGDEGSEPNNPNPRRSRRANSAGMLGGDTRSRGSMLKLEKDSLGFFREIFYQWAVIMMHKFDCLVLPHHTQVVCLQIFRQFMEQDAVDVTTLIAEVSTGEGKSMIIAALAIYAVVVLKKRVHVVVDDVILLERDFQTFMSLFEVFEVMPEDPSLEPRPLTAICCSPSGAKKIDRNVDICYCEARHVESFYASIAKSDCNFAYEDRILILDEVDALVIDEKPNEAFVYPNSNLSNFATSFAYYLQAPRLAAGVKPRTAAEQRCAQEMKQAWEQALQWKQGQDYIYSQDHGHNVMLQKGRVMPTAWSLTLEALNFQSGLRSKILYQERLFVMSRPRVFQRYHRIVGLSGSTGNSAERSFLGQIYGARFVRVPPFLTTCRGESPFHEAAPGFVGEQKVPVYIENNAEAQLARLADIVFEEHLKTPVLVIARDRGQADALVISLQKLATSRGLGSQVVQSLSRSLHEQSELKFKKNLNLSTQPVGRRAGNKMWRITVTDPRGGRGTDYRVDDADADTNGGLLLAITFVPKSVREWTQYLGRTARQDRKGHFCAVLDVEDYNKETSTYGALPQGLPAISKILDWGNMEAAERIKASDALYHQGLRTNELCEVLHSSARQLIDDEGSDGRCRLVELCQTYHGMHIAEIDEAVKEVGLDPRCVPTQAHEISIAALQSAGRLSMNGSPTPKMVAAKKGFAFCLDQSSSMLSSDATAPNPQTGQPMRTTRFDASVGCIRQVFSKHVAEGDCMSLVLFGENLQQGLPMTEIQTRNKNAIAHHLGNLPQPKLVGGTALYDAVFEGLSQLERLGPNEVKFLVCLTDGDDNASRGNNRRGEAVMQALKQGMNNLNLIIISVGRLQDTSLQILRGWVQAAEINGGKAQLIAVDKAAGSGMFSIATAFEQVVEQIQAETMGSMEC